MGLSTEPSLDEQIEQVQEDLRCITDEQATARPGCNLIARNYRAILASLKSLRDQPDAGMRACLMDIEDVANNTTDSTAACEKISELCSAALSQQPVEVKLATCEADPDVCQCAECAGKRAPVAQASGEAKELAKHLRDGIEQHHRWADFRFTNALKYLEATSAAGGGS